MAARQKFVSSDGDHVMLLNIYRAYKAVKGNKVQNNGGPQDWRERRVKGNKVQNNGGPQDWRGRGVKGNKVQNNRGPQDWRGRRGQRQQGRNLFGTLSLWREQGGSKATR